MANSNFVVHNGLTVGPLTIDAVTGSISTSGNITTTGTTTTFINEIVTGTEAVYGNLTANSGYAATSTTTGALVVTGGVGVSGALWLGANLNVPTGSSLLVGTPGSAHANAPLDVTVSANSYAQINIQNISSTGTQASADFVATAPNGTDSANYIDMGINGNNYVVSTWTVNGASDGYLYVNGGGLGIGTDTAGKTVRIFSGGTLNTNIVAEVYAANVTIVGNVNPSSSNLFTLGSTTQWWSKTFSVSATAQYADLAENYVGDTSYEAGTVVDFGGTHEITLCDTDMSSRVAGVVSTNPAYLMNGTQVGENIVAVALTGRVPTKVRGPIRKGDLIVSAGDGHARAENLPQVGTVIGKALEDFDGDAGVIEVVVGKH